MTPDKVVTLEVVDLDGFYEVVDAEAVLGCPYTGMADGPTASGRTGRAAVDEWVATYTPDGVVTLASGYRDDPARDYLLDAEYDQGELEVFADLEGGFTAGMSSVC